MRPLMAILLALVVSFIGVPSGMAQTKPVVLKAGHVSSTIYPHHIGLVKLAEEVKKRTGGQIEIQIFPLSQLGNERDLTEGVRLGTVDMTVVSNAIVANFVPEAVAFDLPYLFENQDHALRALLSPTGQQVVKLVEQKTGKVLAYYGTGTRSIFNKVRPIHVPEDLKGLKIRVLQSKVFIATLNAMGALATPMPFSEVYGALQQGIIDGAENDPASLLGMKHYEHSQYYSLTNHFVLSGYVFINWERWKQLSPEQQRILAEAAELSQREEREYEKRKHEEALADLRRLGIKINDVNRAIFAEKVKPVWQEVAGQYTSLVAEIQKVK